MRRCGCRLPTRSSHDLAPRRLPLSEVARRLGHSVDTLVSTYVGVLDGDEQIANDRIGAGPVIVIATVMSASASSSASTGSVVLRRRVSGADAR